ncbi:MAG: AraC family transcriptional regulator [Leptospiraceae bacterium]|nr:AraC family transcriptional regulator [Leptospiraceae bacterium]
MNRKQKQLVELFGTLMPDTDVLQPDLSGIQLFRIDASFARTPYAYQPQIIILVQGKKKVYLGSEVYCYDAGHYLVLPVPLPAECEGRVGRGEAILGLSIAIDPIEVGEILLAMPDRPQPGSNLPRGIYAAPMDAGLLDTVIRLLQALGSATDTRILGPMIKREILYRILQGEKGEILQAVAHRNKRFFQIAGVLQKIHAACHNNFDIEALARELEMSYSTFHNSFKAVTDSAPLQYIKNVRLHKARSLMIQEGQNATMAAIAVGYESASQFNREYKRLFGLTPARDAANTLN